MMPFFAEFGDREVYVIAVGYDPTIGSVATFVQKDRQLGYAPVYQMRVVIPDYDPDAGWDHDIPVPWWFDPDEVLA